MTNRILLMFSYDIAKTARQITALITKHIAKKFLVVYFYFKVTCASIFLKKYFLYKQILFSNIKLFIIIALLIIKNIKKNKIFYFLIKILK